MAARHDDRDQRRQADRDQRGIQPSPGSLDRAESDGYNALILRTALGWREISAIRALSRYLRQIRAPFSQDYMWETLRNNTAITTSIVALFRARFDPHLVATGAERSARETAILAEIEEQLKSCAISPIWCRPPSAPICGRSARMGIRVR
jgi:hypothetical protein